MIDYFGGNHQRGHACLIDEEAGVPLGVAYYCLKPATDGTWELLMIAVPLRLTPCLTAILEKECCSCAGSYSEDSRRAFTRVGLGVRARPFRRRRAPNPTTANRTLTVRADAAYHALQQARARSGTRAYAAGYHRRAGIEGTISRGLRRCGLRQARYIGLAKTRLQHLLTAVALNFLRLGEWLSGTPRAQTRRTPFTRLMAAAA